MLRLISENQIDNVLNFCDGDPIGTRVGAYLKAYRTNMDFAMFWEQINDGKITSAVSRIDGDMTVCVSENTDYDELSEFVHIIGFNTLFSQAEFFRKINLDCVQGDILKFNGKNKFDDSVGFNIEPAALYDLVCRANSTEVRKEEYLPWLSDFTFRQRRNMLRAVGIYDSGELVSCAMTSAETSISAVISGVATDENFRCRGLAEKCVLALADSLIKLKKENIFVMTENGELTKYYKHLGFDKIGEWGRHMPQRKGNIYVWNMR